MDLSKIPGGTPITLKVKREGTVAEFGTVLVEHVGGCLVCEPMMQDDSMINFAIPSMSFEVSVFDRDAGRLFCWREVEIKAGYYRKTKLCHLIYLKCGAVEINRRNNYRQYIGIEGVAEPFHRPPSKVMIRDVSNNGVGFIAKEKGFFEVGRQIRVSFYDENNRFHFKLDCNIVRERKMETGEVEFGCEVINPPQTLSMYVAHKQLEERKRVLGLL